MINFKKEMLEMELEIVETSFKFCSLPTPVSIVNILILGTEYATACLFRRCQLRPLLKFWVTVKALNHTLVTSTQDEFCLEIIRYGATIIKLLAKNLFVLPEYVNLAEIVQRKYFVDLECYKMLG